MTEHCLRHLDVAQFNIDAGGKAEDQPESHGKRVDHSQWRRLGSTVALPVQTKRNDAPVEYQLIQAVVAIDELLARHAKELTHHSLIRNRQGNHYGVVGMG